MDHGPSQYAGARVHLEMAVLSVIIRIYVAGSFRYQRGRLSLCLSVVSSPLN